MARGWWPEEALIIRGSPEISGQKRPRYSKEALEGGLSLALFEAGYASGSSWQTLTLMTESDPGLALAGFQP